MDSWLSLKYERWIDQPDIGKFRLGKCFLNKHIMPTMRQHIELETKPPWINSWIRGYKRIMLRCVWDRKACYSSVSITSSTGRIPISKSWAKPGLVGQMLM